MKAEQNDNQANTESLLPIRVIAKLTGVNIGTLRAWERRYGLITPHRTESGHRLYSQDDVNLINEVVSILDRGVPISRAKSVLEQRQAQQGVVDENPHNLWNQYLQNTMSAISRFDESGIDDVYNEALSLYPVDVVMRHLIVPTLTELGRRWQDSQGNIAEEHFFTFYIRNRLGARLHHGAKSMLGKQLVIACLPGEYHELGIIMFALAAHAQGYKTLLLGANMPLNELVAVVKRSDSRAIVLAGSYPASFDGYRDDLASFVSQLSVPVFVGGHISVAHNDAISKAGAVAIGEDLSRGLQLVQEVIGK